MISKLGGGDLKVQHTAYCSGEGGELTETYVASFPAVSHTVLTVTEVDPDGKVWLARYLDGKLVSRIDAKGVSF